MKDKRIVKRIWDFFVKWYKEDSYEKKEQDEFEDFWRKWKREWI